MNQSKELLTYRDTRNQLIKSIGVGVNYPIAEVSVRTMQRGEMSNTPTILYSKVSFETSEAIYINNPQEDTTYEIVELNPIEGESTVGAEGKAMSLPGISSDLQPTLTLTTPKISGVERTFSILATTKYLGLQRYLDKVVKIQAGINQNLDIEIDKTTITYDQTVKVTIKEAQADCEYALVIDPFDGEDLPALTDTTNKPVFVSDLDYSKDAREEVLTSFPLKENTKIRVYGRFHISNSDGYLKEDLSVDVIPNTFLEISAVEAVLNFNSQKLFDDGVDEAVAKIKLKETQLSANYQAFFVWIDPTLPPTDFENKEGDFANVDWGTSQTVLGEASDIFQGTEEGDLTIPINKYLPEDVKVKVIATNIESGKSEALQQSIIDPETGEPVIVDNLIRFNIYPDLENPTLELLTNPVAKGQRAKILLQNGQIGAYYQLYKTIPMDEEVGLPQFMTKKRPIGLAQVEIDLSVDPNTIEEQWVLEFETDPVNETTTYFMTAVKPINGLSGRLISEITINVTE